jgi:dihydroxyacetone kinase
VAVLLNNLGSLPVIELQIVLGCVLALLRQRGLVPARVYSGPYMTSLEMCGLSVSLLVVSDDTLSLLDAPTAAPAWIPSAPLDAIIDADSRTIRCALSAAEVSLVAFGLTGPSAVLEVTRAVCEVVIGLEPVLTEYDAICGDGDCGVVMRQGALRVLDDAVVDRSTADIDIIDLSSHFTALAVAVSASMGGTSGALLELCFRAMASSFSLLRSSRPPGDTAAARPVDWMEALSAGVGEW